MSPQHNSNNFTRKITVIGRVHNLATEKEKTLQEELVGTGLSKPSQRLDECCGLACPNVTKPL